MRFLAPELFMFVMQFIMQYLNSNYHITPWLWPLRLRSLENLHFAVSEVRIRPADRNMSVIFFIQTFFTFFSWNLVSHTFGGVHKQCGLARGMGSNWSACIKGLSLQCTGRFAVFSNWRRQSAMYLKLPSAKWQWNGKILTTIN